MQIICPMCKQKLGKVPHFSKCNPKKLSNEEVKNWVFEFNFSPLIQQHGEDIRHMYVIEQIPVQELAAQYGMSWGRMQQVIKSLGIEPRNLKQAASSDRTRQKYQNTCVDLYGSTNALSKNTKAYHKRNITVQKKYGVSNVRQHQSVKNKINQTMLERHGVLRISKLPKFRKHTPNKLESRVSAALTYLDIGHKFSHYIKRRQFDFLITGTKLIIEVQGDFWHANPKYYKADDQIKFITVVKTAKSIWMADKDKQQVAELYGYKVIHIWEDNINALNDDELQSQLLTYLADALHLHLPGQEP